MTSASEPSAARTILITGASRGIGRALAVAFGRAGAELILVARTVGGLEETDDQVRAAGGQPATLVPLDLADHDGIDRLGASLYERWGRLDALIGNAGILGPLSPLGHIEVKTWDQVMAVNLTANWRLIRAMDPLLKLSPAGRAVFLTSGAARKHRPFWGAYAASKAALESLVLTYAAECDTTAVRVNLVNPGPMRTVMRAQAMPGEDPETLPLPGALAPLVMALADPAETRNGAVVAFDPAPAPTKDGAGAPA